MTRRARAFLPTSLAAMVVLLALKIAVPSGAARAQPSQSAAATSLPPAAHAQLERDIATCRSGLDPAALERACTNVLAQQLNIVDLDPASRGHCHFNRAKARIDAGDVPGAIDDLRKAISDDYNPHAAYAQLGTLYLNWQADIVRAESSYRKALELDPALREAHIGLALTLQRKHAASP